MISAYYISDKKGFAWKKIRTIYGEWKIHYNPKNILELGQQEMKVRSELTYYMNSCLGNVEDSTLYFLQGINCKGVLFHLYISISSCTERSKFWGITTPTRQVIAVWLTHHTFIYFLRISILRIHLFLFFFG